MPSRVMFPKDFLWGAATSAYQIEGATHADGRGESIWDTFARTKSNIEDGSNGDVACDHYHLWKEDILLMKRLKLAAYRFSIAWPRVFPSGRPPLNAPGLDFYDKLVDGLLAAGITPYATLYHWDLPQKLEDKGGWTNRATAEAFVEYVDAVTRRLGDRVKSWITHNEPWCASFIGYQSGRHAPGIRDWKSGILSSHHLLLSHGWSIPVIRRNCPGALAGITLNLSPAVAASPSKADAEACRHFDGYMNRWFLDPVHKGEYPRDMCADYAAAGYMDSETPSFIHAGDMEAITVRTDFLGVNYYNRTVTRSDRIPESENSPRTVFLAPESEWTDMGWEVYPAGLYETLVRVHREYAPPKIYITENGASYGERPDSRGHVPDARRLKFVKDHLLATRRAIEEGVPVAGYFAWSLLDNFEWERGYTQRFGMTWVDYETQHRIPKDSAHWYTSVITDNAVPVD